MYICRNCNKECTSQKRYLKHIEHCEEKNELIIRSKRSISSNFSEFEDDDLYSKGRQRSKITKDTVSKLLNDRNKYKSEIKKYKNEIRQQAKTHREELENNETYFQDQINNLLDEKEEFEERVKLRQIYQEQKINDSLDRHRINDLESKISIYKKNISKIEVENKKYKNGIKSRNETIDDLERLNEAIGAQIKQYKTIIQNLKLEINNISSIKQENSYTDKKLRMIEEKYILLQNQLKNANNKIETLKKQNEKIQDTPNKREKEIQNNLRVTRDKCIENLRKQTIELKKIKEENLIIKKSLENNKKIKQSYITNLNNQRDEYEETINKLKQNIESKNKRIEELENKIISK